MKNFAGVSRIALKDDDSRVFATKETVVSIIQNIHVSIGHKGLRKTHKKVALSYCNVSRAVVAEFVKNCIRCVEKMKKKRWLRVSLWNRSWRSMWTKGVRWTLSIFKVCPTALMVRSFITRTTYPSITTYILWRKKTAADVAKTLLRIFIDFDAPSILQSHNGREFTACIIQVNKTNI